MAIEIVFETHATTEDNERGVATGWLPGGLSEAGREQALELGQRRRDDHVAAVFSSDLTRAVQTTTLAFRGSLIPILLDWRLRECDYGDHNGTFSADLHASRGRYLDEPYTHGESWRGAVNRVARFLHDLPLRWESSRVLVIGHVATKFALDHVVRGIPLEQLIEEQFEWQPGWEFRLDAG